MTDSIALPLADTSDMIELHRVFRTCFGQSSRLIESVGRDDAKRGQVASYYLNVLRLLRTHHAGEDLLVTPRLLERCHEQADLIEHVASQHADVIALMDDAEERLAAWSESLDGSERTEVIQALEYLNAELTVHLDDEEAKILPIAAKCMNVAEWGELPGHGMQHFDGDKQWLVMGLIRDQMSANHRTEMDANMAPPVAAMWSTSGQAMYREFIAGLGGREHGLHDDPQA